MCTSFSFGLKGLIVNAGAYLVARVHCNTSIIIVQWSENLDRPIMHRPQNQILSAEFKHKRHCCALSCYALNNSRPSSGSRNMARQFTGQQRSFMVSEKAPRDFTYDVPSDKRKLIVWCGLVGNRIIGPIFVPGNLTGQRYLDIINNVVVPELIPIYGQQRNGAIRRIWYLQDGATPHRARMVYIRLEQLFPNRVIGLGHGIERHPRSPDLTPLDFFLLGVLEVQSVLRWPTCNPTGAAATYH